MYLDGVFFKMTYALNEHIIIATGFRAIWGCILFCIQYSTEKSPDYNLLSLEKYYSWR